MKLRFSLLGLVAFVTILALGLSHLLTTRELSQAQHQLSIYRTELGQLNISQEGRIHWASVRTIEPHHWKWRIYVPTGKHGLFFGTEYSPPKKVDPPENFDGRLGTMRARGGYDIEGPSEFTLSVRAVNDPNVGWLFVCEKTDDGGDRFEIRDLSSDHDGFLDGELDWTLTEAYALDDSTTHFVEQEEAAILLDLRIDDDGVLPMDGLFFWIKRRK